MDFYCVFKRYNQVGTLCTSLGEAMKGIRIAILDDVYSDAKELQSLIEKAFNEVEVFLFDTGRKLLSAIHEGEIFDLLFLDIYLKNENGLEIGKQIRSESIETELVYISSSKEFGFEALELDALHYLLKPFDENKLLEVQQRYYRIKDKRTIVRLPQIDQEISLHMISYIESFHNDIEIHLISGSTIQVRDSLSNFMEHLDDNFLRINRGVIVNMESIEKMNADSCQIDGKVFMLSRKQRAENRKKYTDWLFESMLGRNE